MIRATFILISRTESLEVENSSGIFGRTFLCELSAHVSSEGGNNVELHYFVKETGD
jgi:hypothetical protein